MAGEMVTTAVDDLLEYLKGKDKVAMQDAVSVLNVPLETLQAWVDFLVEEKILGIEYKFTKPFIYLNKEEAKSQAQKAASIGDVKQEFVAHATAQKIPAQKIPDLWRSHVGDALERKKDYFIEQAKRYHLPDAEGLWHTYCENLRARC